MKGKGSIVFTLGIVIFLSFSPRAYSGSYGSSGAFKDNIFHPGVLKPIDSTLKVKVGDKAPDFTLPSIEGDKVSLSQYLGKKNVVLSFVPAAWTPVCSDQWPGYNIIDDLFHENDAILLGITVDNIPTLFAWTNQMVPEGTTLWFPVLSDFWPHGKVADKYGVLRSDGVTERALFVIDKKGIVRYIDVNDINERPRLDLLINELEKLGKKSENRGGRRKARIPRPPEGWSGFAATLLERSRERRWEEQQRKQDPSCHKLGGMALVDYLLRRTEEIVRTF